MCTLVPTKEFVMVNMKACNECGHDQVEEKKHLHIVEPIRLSILTGEARQNSLLLNIY